MSSAFRWRGNKSGRVVARWDVRFRRFRQERRARGRGRVDHQERQWIERLRGAREGRDALTDSVRLNDRSFAPNRILYSAPWPPRSRRTSSISSERAFGRTGYVPRSRTGKGKG